MSTSRVGPEAWEDEDETEEEREGVIRRAVVG